MALPDRFYAVIFDAGSSGTRPFIYRIARTVVDGNDEVTQPAQVVEIVNHNGKSLKNTPQGRGGIQAQEDAAAIATYLDPLFDDVAGILDRLPALPRKYYLFPTGGVRDELTPAQQGTLRGWVENYIEGTRGIARTDYTYGPISGTDEAKYGWVAANRSQARPYDAGYVEMGGATAQIAFPVDPADYATVTATVKKLNPTKKEEMIELYGDAFQNIPEISGLLNRDGPMLMQVLSLWAGLRQPNSQEAQRWVGRGPGDPAKLEEVVKLWEGDMAQLREVVREVGSQVNGIANLENVLKRLEIKKKAKVELKDVGQQKVFLASYPLGSNAGHKKFIETLFAKGARYRLTGRDENNRMIFYDPSRREGYPPKVEANWTIKSRPNNDEGLKGESNLAKTFHLVGEALDELFPGAIITKDLESVLRKLDFIGASNFWWTMCLALDTQGAFNLSTFNKSTRDSSKITHAAFRKMHANQPPFMLEILDKSIFTARWTLHVLSHAFGLKLAKEWDEVGRDMTFTPYNGGGADRNRFSWTLGAAVLLASDDPLDLEQSPIRAPPPAPAAAAPAAGAA